MATGLQFTFTVEGCETSTFAVTEFRGNDGLSLPFSFLIELASREPFIGPDEIVDNNCTLTVWRDGECPLARLSLRQNSRIFQTQTVPEIISILLTT